MNPIAAMDMAPNGFENTHEHKGCVCKLLAYKHIDRNLQTTAMLRLVSLGLHTLGHEEAEGYSNSYWSPHQMEQRTVCGGVGPAEACEPSSIS